MFKRYILHPSQKSTHFQLAPPHELQKIKVIGIQPLAPVQNSVQLKLMQHKTLNFVINLPDVENITK